MTVALTGAACAQEAFRDSPFAGLDGDIVVAIADGDFRASTYGDQLLASPDPALQDRLLVWRLGTADPTHIPVTNSVTSPPEILAVSPDRRFAYVVERLGQRGPGILRTPDLSPGGQLSAVPLTGDPSQGRSTVSLGPNPEAIDLRADGRMLASVSNTPDRSLVHLIPVNGGTLSPPITFDLADLGITGQSSGPRGSVTATSVFWQPGAQVLAVTINTQNRVAFFRVEGAGDALRLTPWGASIETGRDPFTGRFTPDGRHFLTLDWGRDFAATSLEGRLPTMLSRISVIRVAHAGDIAGSHRRIGDAATDLSSEGIAVSPDGTLVAAINMRQTALPRQAARYTPNASVVLLHFNDMTGVLTPIDRAEFPGVLPEGAAFDRSGRKLVVTAFERRDASGGALHVFGIEGSGTAARLVDQGFVETPHGVHHVVIR
ncbi:lactonase family protein [Azomonas macrocytogenes]|uniref:DNA-binding beta-propeller fold protein YncE n=1 Tax=Azomonas macrocytogenes TaxID=69962 RepID=A0A839T4D0_AZOMA|nr:beta-propeller fold lactonase family protein [Azomonas macrocytogenes]MBB3104391.1 DNA-binding beta-propeller fold protein YncE [Azomonas macrocytogenes]